MIVLAIDPGSRTGYAQLDYERERVIFYGWLKRPVPRFRGKAQRLMESADILVIEDQYVGINPQSALRVNEAKAEMIAWWGERGPVYTINPQTWQAALRLKGPRAARKAGAMRYAQLFTGRCDLTADEADVICLGLVGLRRIKSEVLKQRRS